jgi:hypothetical protein
VVLRRPTTSLVLFYPVMAILIVYPPGLFVYEDVVGFGYGDEFVVCRFVTSISMLTLRERRMWG